MVYDVMIRSPHQQRALTYTWQRNGRDLKCHPFALFYPPSDNSLKTICEVSPSKTLVMFATTLKAMNPRWMKKPKDLEDLLFESLQKSEASEPCTYTFRLFFFEVFVFVENIILRAPHISCHIVSCLFFGTVLLLIHHFSLKRFEWGCLELKRDTCTVERKRCAHDPIKTSEDVCSWLSKSSLKLTKLHNHLPFFRIAGLSHGHLQSELLQVPSPFEGLNTKQKGKVSWIKSKHAVNSYHFTFTWSLDPWRINWDRVC